MFAELSEQYECPVVRRRRASFRHPGAASTRDELSCSETPVGVTEELTPGNQSGPSFAREIIECNQAPSHHHHQRLRWTRHLGSDATALPKYDQTVSRWKPSRPVLVALVVLHIIVTAITLRDLSQRSDAQIRGPRWLWRTLTPLQMGNSAIYWLVGRKTNA